jgi:hypothetical protein
MVSQLAKIQKLVEEVKRLRAENADLKAKQPESWLALETAAIDCSIKPGTLLAWVHKSLVKHEKRGGRYYVEINSVREHAALVGRKIS